METISQNTSNFSSIRRNITKYLHFRHNSNFSPSRSFDYKDESPEKAEMESLLANIFTRISATKAAYAQLQIAQSPYDPNAIQSADQALITELKHLSDLKHAYYKNQCIRPSPFNFQIQENLNLIKTYQITIKKLESDIKYKDSKIVSLEAQLMELESTDDLQFSDLNPTHFINEVQYTIRAIKSYIKLMVSEMVSSGWNIDAAAKSIQPDIQNKPTHNIFAFESFVAQKMFSDFSLRDFGLFQLEERTSWESHQSFIAFNELRSVKVEKIMLNQKGRLSSFGKFCRAKYLKLVHPKMEASFFGDLDHRGVISSCHGFPGAEFFLRFAEVAKRVWLLHCLFFSFDKELDLSIFQVKRGCRFSDVYMESVVEEKSSVVGFTVIPGFRIGNTVIRSKVYPMR